MVKVAAGHTTAFVFHILRMGAIAFAVMLSLGTPIATAADTCGTPENPAADSLRYVEYFLSKPQDSAGCAVKVVDGHIVVQAPTSNMPRLRHRPGSAHTSPARSPSDTARSGAVHQAGQSCL